MDGDTWELRMRIEKIGAVTCILIASIAMTVSALATDAVFQQDVIDVGVAGDCKMIGDINGDNLPDLVVGGGPGENLNWYRHPDWLKTQIAIPNVEFTTDGALGDLDNDGDLDIIIPDGSSGNNLIWFRNPLPSGDPSVGAQWSRRVIGAVGDWCKDVEIGDYDGNGLPDVATRSNSTTYVFFQVALGSWSRVQLISGLTGEGMASGDIDGDGDDDLVLQGFWLRNPRPAADPKYNSWSQHIINAGLYAEFKALVIDLDQDGITDVLFSDSEGTGDAAWYEPTTGAPTGSWTKHTIVASLDRCHTLQVADIDLDGDRDVVLGQMHTSQAAEIAIHYNLGAALSWRKQVISTDGIHNGVVADLGNDSDFDIFGCNWTGNPPVRIWENLIATCPPADINGDGAVDLADIAAVFASYGLAVGDPGYNANADLNDDGIVDLPDLASLLAEYGVTCGT